MRNSILKDNKQTAPFNFFSISLIFLDLMKLILVLLLTWFCFSCSDESDEPTSEQPNDTIVTKDPVKENPVFQDQVAKGKIGGDGFEIGTYSRVEEINGNKNLFFVLRDKGAVYDNPCGFVGFEGSGKISFTVPNEVGLFKLGIESELNLKAKLYHSKTKSNTTIVNGAIEVTSIGAESISGKIKVISNDDNSVDGSFTAKLCDL